MDSSAQSAKEREGEGETSSTSSSGEKQKKKSLFSTSSFKSGFKVPSMKMPDLKVYLCLPTPTSSPDEPADTCVHSPACIFTHIFFSCSQRSIWPPVELSHRCQIWKCRGKCPPSLCRRYLASPREQRVPKSNQLQNREGPRGWWRQIFRKSKWRQLGTAVACVALD